MCSPLNIFDEESYLSPLIIFNHMGTYRQHWHWQAPAASLLFQLFPEHTQKLKQQNRLGMSGCQCKFMIPDDAQKPHWLSKPFLLYLSDSFQKPTHDQGLTVWTKADQTEIGWWPSVQAPHWVHIHLTLNWNLMLMMPMLKISMPLLRRTKLWSEAV